MTDQYCRRAIGRRIADRRKQLNLTQEQAAERSGLSHQFFSSVESGLKNMRAESLVKVSIALDLSTDYILTGKSNVQDLNHITSLLAQLDEVQLKCAEEILKNLIIACEHSDSSN